MNIKQLYFSDVYQIDFNPVKDERGCFMRVYDQDIFNKNGIDRTWVQHNLSLTKKRDTVRGLHFQLPPRTEAKLLRVVEGSIFDVFVDLRKDSPTFGEWGSIELTKSDNCSIFIPRGFAHGFCTLSNNTKVFYQIDNYYDSELASTIHWNSPTLEIPWPVDDPILSKKDRNADNFETFNKKHDGILV